MKKLINYFKKEFGIKIPGEITWCHDVNTKTKLQRFLNKPDTLFIESDVRISPTGSIITAHSQTESDQTFDQLITQMAKSKQGLKVDFKDPEIIIPCLKKLSTAALPQPIIIHADVLQGCGNPSKFNPIGFLALHRQYLPKGILSLGWTTTKNSQQIYTDDNISEMLNLCRDEKQVIISARAYLMPKSWKYLKRLTKKEGYYLNVWNDEPFTEKLFQWIKDNTDPSKTFYDFVNDNKDPLKFWLQK